MSLGKLEEHLHKVGYLLSILFLLVIIARLRI